MCVCASVRCEGMCTVYWCVQLCVYIRNGKATCCMWKKGNFVHSFLLIFHKTLTKA